VGGKLTQSSEIVLAQNRRLVAFTMNLRNLVELVHLFFKPRSNAALRWRNLRGLFPKDRRVFARFCSCSRLLRA